MLKGLKAYQDRAEHLAREEEITLAAYVLAARKGDQKSIRSLSRALDTIGIKRGIAERNLLRAP